MLKSCVTSSIAQNPCNPYGWDTMAQRKLRGRSILIAASQLETALDLQDHLVDTGARVLTAYRLQRALEIAEFATIAVIDIAPSGEPIHELCRRLIELNVPIILYSESATRYPGKLSNVPIVTRSTLENIVDLVGGLLDGPGSTCDRPSAAFPSRTLTSRNQPEFLQRHTERPARSLACSGTQTSSTR